MTYTLNGIQIDCLPATLIFAARRCCQPSASSQLAILKIFKIAFDFQMLAAAASGCLASILDTVAGKIDRIWRRNLF